MIFLIGWWVFGEFFVVFLGVIFAGFSLWVKGLLLILVAVFGFMNPVFGVILSAIFLHEDDQASGLVSILSLVLVCIGIYVVNSGKLHEK